MNLYRGVLLAGYGLFPSCYSMLFRQKHSKILPNENVLGGNREYQYSMALDFWSFVFITIALLLFLYI